MASPGNRHWCIGALSYPIIIHRTLSLNQSGILFQSCRKQKLMHCSRYQPQLVKPAVNVGHKRQQPAAVCELLCKPGNPLCHMNSLYSPTWCKISHLVNTPTQCFFVKEYFLVPSSGGNQCKNRHAPIWHFG